jgi:hypothetical protein
VQNEIQMERGISSTGGQTGREPRKNPRSEDLKQRRLNQLLNEKDKEIAFLKKAAAFFAKEID